MCMLVLTHNFRTDHLLHFSQICILAVNEFKVLLHVIFQCDIETTKPRARTRPLSVTSTSFASQKANRILKVTLESKTRNDKSNFVSAQKADITSASAKNHWQQNPVPPRPNSRIHFSLIIPNARVSFTSPNNLFRHPRVDWFYKISRAPISTDSYAFDGSFFSPPWTRNPLLMRSIKQPQEREFEFPTVNEGSKQHMCIRVLTDKRNWFFYDLWISELIS